jgi:hypothetical protein
VTSIGDKAFYGCTGLTSISVDSDNSVYDSRNNCNAIIETATNALIYGCKSTVIPDSVTSIDRSAFSGCTGLTSVIIPDSVTSIENRSFGYVGNFEDKIDGFTIYGVPGSAAEQYANDNGFTFIEYVDAAIGDMTGDGKVNVRDVTAMQRHLAGLEELTDDRLALADTNGDGKVDINDATHLQRYLAEYDVTIG